MDPPIKLFGQTIAFTTSTSSQDEALDGVGPTSPEAWEDSSSPEDGVESIEENVVKTELAQTECPSGSFSSGSNGADEEMINGSPCDGYGLVLPLSEATKIATGTAEDVDGEDGVFGRGEETNGGDEAGGRGGAAKMPRRPDKAVACPRCHSLETKFCYYNNYNVNQPRHFCKHCQRYWTAGGTLRNVPVGAGRRKNKHGSVVPPRQTPDMGLVRGDEPDVASPLLVGGKGGSPLPMPLQVPVVQAVLGPSPLPFSPKPPVRVTAGPSDGGAAGTAAPYGVRVPSLEATYILTPGDAVKPGDTAAGAAQPRVLHASAPFSDHASSSKEADAAAAAAAGWRPTMDHGSTGATISGQAAAAFHQSMKGGPGSAPNVMREGDAAPPWGSGGAAAAAQGPPGPFGFFNGAWPYGYNVGWAGGAAFCAGGVSSVGNPMPPPTPAGVAAVWGGSAAAAGSMWTGMPWAVPGLSWSPAGWGPPPPWSLAPWPLGAAAPPAGTPMAVSPAIHAGPPGPVGPPPGVPAAALGKHPRPFEGGGAVDGTVWAPKSLRMADPEEAMRSSVWRILGAGSHPDVAPASTFKAFQPKSAGKKIADGDQQAMQATLHANPAAMSRSMYFHESN